MLKNVFFVIPTKVGIQAFQELLDSGFRRNDVFHHPTKHRPLLFVALLLLAGLTGFHCAWLEEGDLSQSEIKNFETRDLDAPFDAVYAAATEAFFDLGYTMTHSEKSSGILVGEKRIDAVDASWWNTDANREKTEAEKYDWLQLTLLVRKETKTTSKIRIKTAIDKEPRLDKKAINEVWVYIQRQVLMEESPSTTE